MSVFESHPAALIFPLMDGVELTTLADDVRAHGLLEPIVLHEGMVLDGRNRLRACELAGVEPSFAAWQSDGMTPIEWVVSKNIHRRHLTTAQRAALALDLLPHLEAEAKERQREHGGTAPGRPADTSSESGRSDEKAADLVGVGRSTVAATKAIQKRDPELVNRMRAGEISVSRASREAGFEGMAQGDAPISESEPSIAYGKGDKWREASEPLRRYLAAWEKRGFGFRHVNPREAKKRVQVIDELIEGLREARVDLEPRSQKATLRV